MKNGFIEGGSVSRPGSDEAYSRKRETVPPARHKARLDANEFSERGVSARVLSLPTHEEENNMLVKSMIVASALVFAAPAFAQGVSDKTPGHKMQGATKSTAPGASEYAPGHKMQNATKSTAPGASEYAPGHATTGSNTKATTGSNTMKR
jgi:hypothetical protein